ncbi:GNAT family N-acetyltransferase [Shewanella donghaensis]|uniref:GNAT family N-acetyltransferase n=1 Tax=Shewanella donghaensis TaxID=238836 RepID=UPI001181EEBA|nr:GNAT family N-acetyltransferase [Shewanella donghaensis]
MNYSFNTQRLSMRLIQQGDFDIFVQLYSDPKTMRKICAPFEPQQIKQFFETALQDNLSPIKQRWVWVIEQNGLAIGLQSLFSSNNQPNCAEIGIMLLRKSNGKLLAEEATTGLINFGFNTLKLERICAQYDSTNYATHRSTQKLGFIIEQPITNHSDEKNTKDKPKNLTSYLTAEIWQKSLPNHTNTC